MFHQDPVARSGRLSTRHMGVLTVAVLMVFSGCERAEPIRFGSSDAVLKLKPELQLEVQKFVREYTGTAAEPKLPGRDDVKTSHLLYGQSVYMKRCQQCHGVSGDGRGPQADFMYPRPRDYRRGIFKFTSTPYGSKPKRSDLVRTVRRGVPGTSMPSFDRLSKKDLEAVVDYVLVLTHRGELENQLAYEAEVEEELDADYVPDLVNDIVEAWHNAEFQTVHPLTPMPEFTAENVVAGRAAFLSKGCSKCHGEDGRGHTRDNIGKDAWGFSTRAADLTSGMLRGGQRPEDVYRRILSGINGTPMPGFENALKQEPETIWNLVSYVLYVSNQRRRGNIPPAGLLKPYDAGPVAAAESSEEAEDAEE